MEIVPGGFEREKFDAGEKGQSRRQAAYLSPVSALDKNPNAMYKAYIHRQRHHDRLYVVDLPQE